MVREVGRFAILSWEDNIERSQRSEIVFLEERIVHLTHRLSLLDEVPGASADWELVRRTTALEVEESFVAEIGQKRAQLTACAIDFTPLGLCRFRNYLKKE